MPERRGYFFATAAQWDACEIAQADREAAAIRPLVPYEPHPVRIASRGAGAPAFARTGEIIWRDANGHLMRLAPGDDEPDSHDAPHAIAAAGRIVPTSDSLWVASPVPQRLECFEADTLTRRFTVDLAGARIADIAGDGCDGLFALIERGGAWQVVLLDCAGSERESIGLERVEHATQLLFLRRQAAFVVLAANGRELLWFARHGGPPSRTIACAALGACFVGENLGRDPGGRVFLSGADAAKPKDAGRVMVLSPDGIPIGDLAMVDRPRGLAGSRAELLVADDAGLARFALADRVPDEAMPVHASVVTPVLRAPDVPDARHWLRVEAEAELPAGTTIEIAWTTALQPETWSEPVRFQGSPASTGPFRTAYAAPLHDVPAAALRVRVALHAAAGAQLPALRALAVLFPGGGLMEHLPALYRREEAPHRSFLRALVGVLETGTRALDERIAGLGRHIHPDTAPPEWLDFVARWLDLPWDDALDGATKREIVRRSAVLARGRGTRAGLEALLAILLPARSFRIADDTTERGFAIVGGGAAQGAVLPAMLGGLPASSPQLNVKARLGCLRLSPDGAPEDDTSRFVGRIAIDVSTSVGDRGAVQPWLAAMVRDMVPATTRVQIRWVPPEAFADDRLGDELELTAPQPPHLGSTAVTGSARLPERGTTLSGWGFDSGSRLQ